MTTPSTERDTQVVGRCGDARRLLTRRASARPVEWKNSGGGSGAWSVKRDSAGCLVAVAATIIGLTAVVGLTFASLPVTSPPSEVEAGLRGLGFALVFLVAAIGVTVVPAGRASLVAVAAASLALVTLERPVVRAFERAQVEGCQYGSGSGSQDFCLAGTSPPGLARNWLVLLIGVLVIVLVLGFDKPWLNNGRRPPKFDS